MEFKRLKRSHRDVNLYFEGYVRQESIDPLSGRKKTNWVYRGDYYIFSLEPDRFRRFRLGSALRVFAAVLLFAAAHILGPQGSILPWVGIPAVLSVIPLCFVCMGLCRLLTVRDVKMTIRQYSFGLGRMENALWGLWLLWGISLLGELVFILSHRAWATPESLSAVMMLAAELLAVLQQRSQSRLLSQCIHKPETKSET